MGSVITSPTDIFLGSTGGICTFYCSPTAVSTSNNCCVGSLSISTSVTSIAECAYNSCVSPNYIGCGTITSVTVPSTVTSVGKLLLLTEFVIFIIDLYPLLNYNYYYN